MSRYVFFHDIIKEKRGWLLAGEYTVIAVFKWERFIFKL